MKEARQDILDAIETYYSVLGFKRDNSRVTHQAQARTALSNVMREHGMTYEEIKLYQHRNHATIIHHCKVVHANGLSDWRGYRDTYETCKDIVGVALLGDINDVIAMLESKRDELQAQIDEYLKKKEENDARNKELATYGVEV
jgi:DNA-binding transcriptional MerR regulator